MREVLYDTTWQCLRVSCLGAYNDKGGWQTVEGTKSNIEVLSQYVHSVSRSSEEHKLRLYRVINCLNAIRMGLQGQEKQLRANRPTPFSDEVRAQLGSNTARYYAVGAFRDSLQLVRKNYVNYTTTINRAADYWDWDKQAKELEKLARRNKAMFNAVHDDLARRLELAQKALHQSNTKIRPELTTYVGLMTNAMDQVMLEEAVDEYEVDRMLERPGNK